MSAKCYLLDFVSNHPTLSSAITYHISSVHTYIFFLLHRSTYAVLTVSSPSHVGLGLLGCISRHLLSSCPPPFLGCYRIQKVACGIREGAASVLVGVNDGQRSTGNLEWQAEVDYTYGRKQISSPHGHCSWSPSRNITSALLFRSFQTTGLSSPYSYSFRRDRSAMDIYNMVYGLVHLSSLLLLVWNESNYLTKLFWTCHSDINIESCCSLVAFR